MSSSIKTGLLEKAIIIVIGGILDFSINYVFLNFLRVPLFLDTIFVMAVLFMLGPVESLLVYLVETACTATRYYLEHGNFGTAFYYIISAIVIIVITWLFIRRNVWRKGSVNQIFLYLCCAAVVSAIFCSIVSGIICYFTFQDNLDKWAFDQIIFSLSSEKIGFLQTCIVGRIPLTTLDRIITTLSGFLISYLWEKIKNEKK